MLRSSLNDILITVWQRDRMYDCTTNKKKKVDIEDRLHLLVPCDFGKRSEQHLERIFSLKMFIQLTLI